MALLAAPVSTPAEEPWLRACVGPGVDFHLLRPAGGADAELGRGLEDLLRVAELDRCVWVARLVGPRESVAYALDVLGSQARVADDGGVRGAVVATVVLGPGTRAMTAAVDACAGARHQVVLAQCALERVDEVQAALAQGHVAAALSVSRMALLRDAPSAWAVVGVHAGGAGLLGRVSAPAAPSALPSSATAARPVPAWRTEPGRPLRRVPIVRLRVHSRLTAALSALLIAAVAAGSAGWVIVHRGQPAPPDAALRQRIVPVAGMPPPRTQAMAATWDRTADVILFGGADAGSGHGTPLQDTWRGALPPAQAWDSLRTPNAPSPRFAGAMAADPADGYVLLYGGEGDGNTGLGDTWSFGGGWSQLHPPTQPPSGPALAATEPTTGRVLMVTTCCPLSVVPTGERMQTWRWSGGDWQHLGPAPGWVTTASIVADGWDSTVVMVASAGGGLGATFIWDGSSWSQHRGVMQPPVAAGSRPQLAYDPRSHTVLDVVTGQDGSHSTWAWNGSFWSERETTGGPPVVGLVLPDPADGHAVLYGGVGEGDEFTQRWFWTGATWAESIRPPAIAQLPTAGSAAALAADPGLGGLVMFGGSQTLDETWVWTGATWSQAFSTVPGPPPREGASMAYDPVSRQAVMVGGRLGTGAPAEDMWTWQGSSWRRAGGGLPPASYQAPMAWDRVHHEAVLVLPDDTAGPLPSAQTWTWDGAGWTRRAPAVSPPLRSGASMTFDPATAGVLLLVPCCPGSSNQRSQTWRWDGVSWQRLQTVHSPPGRALVAEDGLRNQTVAVTECCPGLDVGAVGPPQTWVWDGRDWTRSPAVLPALQNVSAVVTDAGGNALLVARVAGAGPRHPLDGLWRWTGVAWDRLM
jgi:hypothetical protein